jgi:hypothetical protein
MEASSWRLLDGAKSNTIDGFLQRRGNRSKKKLRSRGGFQPVFPLYHMNRHNKDTPAKNQNKKT